MHKRGIFFSVFIGWALAATVVSAQEKPKQETIVADVRHTDVLGDLLWEIHTRANKIKERSNLMNLIIPSSDLPALTRFSSKLHRYVYEMEDLDRRAQILDAVRLATMNVAKNPDDVPACRKAIEDLRAIIEQTFLTHQPSSALHLIMQQVKRDVTGDPCVAPNQHRLKSYRPIKFRPSAYDFLG